MNRFRKLGLIDYTGTLRVHCSPSFSTNERPSRGRAFPTPVFLLHQSDGIPLWPFLLRGKSWAAKLGNQLELWCKNVHSQNGNRLLLRRLEWKYNCRQEACRVFGSVTIEIGR